MEEPRQHVIYREASSSLEDASTRIRPPAVTTIRHARRPRNALQTACPNDRSVPSGASGAMSQGGVVIPQKSLAGRAYRAPCQISQRIMYAPTIASRRIVLQ